MPALFVGHGSPMNAIEDNDFSRAWLEVGRALPRPRGHPVHLRPLGDRRHAGHRQDAAADHPRLRRLPARAVRAAVPGARLARAGASWCCETVTGTPVRLDHEWGLDHGTWSVLCRLFPAADVPVVQLSLDRTQPPADHYALAQAAAAAAPARRADRGQRQHRAQPAPGGLARTGPTTGRSSSTRRSASLIAARDHAALVDYPRPGAGGAPGRADQRALPAAAVRPGAAGRGRAGALLRRGGDPGVDLDALAAPGLITT